MTLIDRLSRLLLAPPARGTKALLYGAVLVAMPTFLRLLLGLLTDRIPLIPYVPFVIVAAIILDWRYAIAVALGSWIVADLLFVEPDYHPSFSTYELIAFSIFFASAALIIIFAKAVRVVVENSLRPSRPDGIAAPVVFSLERGQAWASWYGSHSWVRLGPEQEVAEMMQDFLAQRDVAKRLQSAASLSADP